MSMEFAMIQERPPICDQLQAISQGNATPAEQWQALGAIRSPRGVEAADYCAAMFDFAQGHYDREGETPASLLVRAMALERGVALAWIEFTTDPNFSLHLRDDVVQLYRGIKEEIPEYFQKFLPQPLPSEPLTGEDRVYDANYKKRKSYIEAVKLLAEHEDIPINGYINPELDDIDLTAPYLYTPMLVFYLMDRQAGNRPYGPRPEGALVPYMPPAVLKDMFRVTLSKPEELEPGVAKKAQAFAQLARSVKRGGVEHNAPIEFLYSLPDNEALAYINELNELYRVGDMMAGIYPYADKEQMAVNTQGRVANALYALEHYFRNGNIDVSLPWYSPGSYMHIKEDNPLEVMRTLRRGVTKLHGIITDPAAQSKLEVRNGNFDLYSLSGADTAVPQASHCIRSVAAEDYDPDYEFAGDVTDRFRIRLDDTGTIALKNAEQTPDTLCIRLESDKWGISLDIGAMADNPYRPGEDIEVRIGRFFGFGNYLHSRAVDTKPTWNHIRGVGVMFGNDAQTFNAAVENRRRQMAETAYTASLGSCAISRG